MSHVNHPEPLTLNQAAEAAGVSRSTIKRRLNDLEEAGARRLPSGEWRIPREALAVLIDGSRGSIDEPREPRLGESREPRHEPVDPSSGEPREPREPPLRREASEELVAAQEALAAARLEAAEWRARAEERADRITELATRAEAAEARLDRMITSQTALALTLKEQQQTHAVGNTTEATPEPGPSVAPEPTQPAFTPDAFTQAGPAPRSAGITASPARSTIGERFRNWREGRRSR